MGIFSKARDLYTLQKQARSLKKDLKNVHIEAAFDGITVILTGEQECLSVQIDESAWADLKAAEYGKKRLEDAFLKAHNKAAKKAQEIAASRSKGLWKELGIQR